MVFLNFPVSLDSTLSTLGFLFLFLSENWAYTFDKRREISLSYVRKQLMLLLTWRPLDFPSHVSYWGEAVRGRAAGSSGSRCRHAWLRHWDIRRTIKLSIEYGLLWTGFYYRVMGKKDSSAACSYCPLKHNLGVSWMAGLGSCTFALLHSCSLWHACSSVVWTPEKTSAVGVTLTELFSAEAVSV